jgi:outer membrane protein OmpA-like peptidoglycan-associated protein
MKLLAAFLAMLVVASASAEPATEARWSSYRDFWFDYDSALLDKSDADKIADVANYSRQNPSYRVAIDGATDAADARLVERRVGAVREALIHAGVPAYKIQVGDYGNRQLRRERRVEVLMSARD